jgi:hypothetical protein
VRLSKALARGVRSDHLKPRTKVLNREVLLSSVDRLRSRKPATTVRFSSCSETTSVSWLDNTASS